MNNTTRLSHTEVGDIFLALHLHRVQQETATGLPCLHLRLLEERCLELAELPMDSTDPPVVDL